MHVILTIDGTEVYNNHNTNQPNTSEVVTEPQYEHVPNPTVGKKIFLYFKIRRI